MTIAVRLKTFLDANQVAYTWLTHPVTYTAQAAAASLHVSGKEVAKTVVLRAGEETLLAVLPASHHVDLEKIGRLVGKSLRLASEQEFRELFPDCELGVMPPFGSLYNVSVYVMSRRPPIRRLFSTPEHTATQFACDMTTSFVWRSPRSARLLRKGDANDFACFSWWFV
jgi:prolyl-tRNA editing enzyme YbaK/EbsC (Cys-tRNA(Pro) deacylase)